MRWLHCWRPEQAHEKRNHHQPKRRLLKIEGYWRLASYRPGRDYKIQFDVALDSLAPAWHWNDDISGGMLIGTDGAIAMVLPKVQGEVRYYHLDSGLVDFQRPAAANAILLKWSIWVGEMDERRVVAAVDVRPQQAA